MISKYQPKFYCYIEPLDKKEGIEGRKKETRKEGKKEKRMGRRSSRREREREEGRGELKVFTRYSTAVITEWR